MTEIVITPSGLCKVICITGLCLIATPSLVMSAYAVSKVNSSPSQLPDSSPPPPRSYVTEYATDYCSIEWCIIVGCPPPFHSYNATLPLTTASCEEACKKACPEIASYNCSFGIFDADVNPAAGVEGCRCFYNGPNGVPVGYFGINCGD